MFGYQALSTSSPAETETRYNQATSIRAGQMAPQGSFSSSQSSHSSTPASTPGVACGVAPMTTATFSIFQEGPGRPLVFAPPMGTPELQSLVDLFIALDIPVSMKMEMIQRDFETHTQRTNERYKTYVVTTASITSSGFTSSPSSIFLTAFEPTYQSGPVSGGSGSGSGSGSSNSFLEVAPVAGPSPNDTDLADSLFSLPLFPAPTQFGDYSVPTMAGPVSSSDVPTWISTAPVSAPSLVTAPWSNSPRQHQQRRWQRQHHRPSRLPNNSMQIVTRDGEDVTHMSSRATRTREERENTRIVRQRGACADCRRKKTRCDPNHHTGHSHDSTGSTSRAAPYAAAAQSGRAKEEAVAAQAAKAAKDKAEGKKPVTTADPVIMATVPQTPSAILVGSARDATTAVHDVSTLGWDMFRDSFDWAQLSGQDRLFTDEELDLELAVSMETDTAFSGAFSPAHTSTTHATEAGLAQNCSYRTLPQSRSTSRLADGRQQSQAAVTSGTETNFGDGPAGLPGVPVSPSIPSDVPLESFNTNGSRPISTADLGMQPSLGDTTAGSEHTEASSCEGGDGDGDGDGDGRDQSHGRPGQSQTVRTPEQPLPKHQHSHRHPLQDGQELCVGRSGCSGGCAGSGSNSESIIASYEGVSVAEASPSSSCISEQYVQQPQTETQPRIAASAAEDISEPLDVGALCAGLSALVTSLIPSLLIWRVSQDSGDSASEVTRGVERLVMGSSPVICQ